MYQKRVGKSEDSSWTKHVQVCVCICTLYAVCLRGVCILKQQAEDNKNKSLRELEEQAKWLVSSVLAGLTSR